MYELKAFGHIGAMVDNTRTVVAPVGELSPLSMTYSREKEYYSTATIPGHGLIVFSSKRDGKVEQTDPVLAADLIAVNRWTYQQATAGRFNSNSESYRAPFIEEFGEKYSIWSIGAMVKAGNNVFAPGVIEIRDLKDEDIRYRIWYADEAFSQQFDEYYIAVTSPVDDLESFFLGAQATQTALNERTPDISTEKIEEAKEGYPETYLTTPMYEWYDPNKVAARKPVYWPVVIYGIAGNNVDAIKEALREYLLGNSTRDKEEWAEVFPEIFTATEFIHVPLYGLMSIPNRTPAAGLYSSISNMKRAKSELTRLVRGEGYTEDWLEEHGELVSTSYKAMNMATIGGPKNRDNVFELYQRYPDYISVDTTSLDFARPSAETRRFILALKEMISIAETMRPDTSIPVKYTRLNRDGILYLVQTIDKFQHLVVSKYSYDAIGIGEDSAAGEPV